MSFEIFCKNFNSFHVTGLFLYPLKTSENLCFFLYFQGVKKETRGMKWVNWERSIIVVTGCRHQKQPSIGVLRKRCYKNIEQIYRKTPVPKCDSVIEVALRHGYSPVNLLHIFRTPFNKNKYGGLLLLLVSSII